ncbi:MAG: hypothetical protein CSYNP_01357 [Syntrophus sp. SKADARSKE-3]|nr:hypothetical protein [Syntrophus sp. SKADARSKE-3]
MLMLTHAWVLSHFLQNESVEAANPELFVYNICPDFLPVHELFSSEITHRVSRFKDLPPKYRKAAFIHFHLMVDDMAHHGKIDEIPVTTFNPYSQGYTYLKGKPLIQPLMALYERHGNPIDFKGAAYRSHMVIEMTYDLALFFARPDECGRLINIMCKAMNQLNDDDKLAEFSEVVGWFYSKDRKKVEEAVRKSIRFYTESRMNAFMTLDGRIRAFIRKFGLDDKDIAIYSDVEVLMSEGLSLVGDYEEFLDPTLAEIRKVGFNPVISF